MSEQQEKFTKEQMVEDLRQEGVPEDIHESYLDVAREKGILVEDGPEASEEGAAREGTPEQKEPLTADSGDSPPEEGDVEGDTEAQEGSSDKTEETDSSEPVEYDENGKKVPLAALQEERRKRQERDRQIQNMQNELQQLKQMLLQQQQQQQQQMQQRESEGDGYKDPLETLIEEKLQKKLEPIEQANQRRSQAEAFNSYIEQKEAEARNSHSDYDEVTKPVIEYAQQQAQSGDMSTLQMIFNSPNPAEMTYVIGTSYKYQQMLKANQEAESQRKQEESGKVKQKVDAMDSLPRGSSVSGGMPSRGAVLKMSDYARWPEDAKRAALEGRKPPGYVIEP